MATTHINIKNTHGKVICRMFPLLKGGVTVDLSPYNGGNVNIDNMIAKFGKKIHVNYSLDEAVTRFTKKLDLPF